MSAPSLLLFLLSATGAGPAPPPAVAPQQWSSRASVAQARSRPPVLDRDPAALPRAEPGRWSHWKPDAPVPEDLDGMLQSGMRAYLDGDHPRALEAFFALLEQKPDFPPALYQAGTAYFRLRRYGDALLLLERFLEVAPGEVAATRAIGHCLYSLGRYEEAAAHYERVLAVLESPEALRGKGLALAQLGRTEPALAALRRAVELRPEHAGTHVWIARVLRDLERPDEALAAALRAVDLDPFDPKGWFLSARLLWDLGREEEAREAERRFERQSRLRQQVLAQEERLLALPRALEPLLRLLELHRAAGDLAGAQSAASRLLRRHPGDVGAHLAALDALAEAGDAGGARSAALALERIAGGEARAWRRLAAFWSEAGEPGRAREAAERLRRLAPPGR